MRLIFHPEARAEFLHDIDYYAEQRRGLGIRFADVIEATIRHILVNPVADVSWKGMSDGA